MTDARRRLLALLLHRAGELQLLRDPVARAAIGRTGPRMRCGAPGYPDLVCIGWPGHQLPHFAPGGWTWFDPDSSQREKPNAAALPHWEAVLPPAVGTDGWARPWCYRCNKPVADVKRVPLRDGRTAITVLCHGQWQAVVATREQVGRIQEWKTAFGPGQPGLLQLSDATATKRPELPGG